MLRVSNPNFAKKKEGSEEGWNAISSRFILKTDALLNVNIKTL